MKNYVRKIPLGDGKFAYDQEKTFRDRGYKIVGTILKKWTPPSIYYHTYKKGGHVAAIHKHKSCDLFSKVDIERFFYNCTKTKVIRSLKKIGFDFYDANEIASESVVRTDYGFSLPYGFVQSPLLSGLCLHQSQAGKALLSLDKDILATVYVDDIILSGLAKTGKLNAATDQVIDALQNSGFPPSPKKCELLSDEITSFNVHLSSGLAKITDARMGQFKQQLIEAAGIDDVENGILNYVASINQDQKDKLVNFLASI